MVMALKKNKFVNPVSDGIGPVNWLKLALKEFKFVNPVSDGICPVASGPAP